jgi:hypothetical protein
MTAIDFAERDGRRSSQRAGRSILSEAIASSDEACAGRISAETDWRKSYIPLFRDVVGVGARSTKNALAIAEAGLRALHQEVVTAAPEGDRPIAATLENGQPFETKTKQGRGERRREVAIPYRQAMLSGDALRRQLDAWVDSGIIEASAAAAVIRIAAEPGTLDLSDQTIVLLGAASEMGPLEHLAGWGANVVALDLPRDHLWERIHGLADSGAGRLLYPTRNGRTGCDILTELPDIRAWLHDLGGSFVVGNYLYADGGNFVRVAAAADALIVDLADAGKLDMLAYLATPTDVFVVSEEIAQAARANRRRRPPILQLLSANRLYARQYETDVLGEDGRVWGMADSLVPIQGPNYALAKHVQRWRAIVAAENGIRTSANVAPATATTSVTKNRLLAAAYRGAPHYGVEIFEPATSRALMALLLVHDLRFADAHVSPESSGQHPYDLFVDQAAHGGLWRNGYEPRSVLPLALLRGLIRIG